MYTLFFYQMWIIVYICFFIMIFNNDDSTIDNPNNPHHSVDMHA